LRVFTIWRFLKCSKTPTINILGPMQYNGCVFATSVIQNSAIGLKHKFGIFLHSVGFQNAPKTLPNNICSPLQMNGCFGYEIIFATSAPRNSAVTLKTQI
jgi:hypothetical protein